jgi:hypothetical protein
MGEYVCNQCNKEFSRKWNALRHNKQIHQEFAIIYDKTTGFTIRNSIQENDIPFINSFVEELNIYKICGKLLFPLTELEKVLYDMPESERIKYISSLIVAAINAPDPVALIQYNLDFERSVRDKQKIVSYLAKGNNMNNIQAEHYLKEMIRSSRYFKNYTKLDHTKLKSV